jgi:phospholipase/carboxylesterase
VAARAGGALLLAMGLVACGQPPPAGDQSSILSEPDTRLHARPSASANSCSAGTHELRLQTGRRALLRIAPGAIARKRPLLLALHGAGSGGAPGGLWAFRGAWSLPGLVLVAPAAAGSTWTLGPTDIRFVDRALQAAFRRCPVDPRRIAVGGFSAGAGLALWLGLTNGDLFRSVTALSAGSSLPARRVGKPRVFLAHGTKDEIIPIEYGGDAVAPRLRSEGYAVTYRRFDGGHRPVQPVARAAVLRELYGRS